METLHSDHQQILAVFEDTEQGLHTKEDCEALGARSDNHRVENARAKLKHLSAGAS
ncbi:hypothetical protein [Streptomyces sp. Ac-502]|uniref:hypothetical protein n=1 Tax=Streptomyces sp. Ac-502 TaxID=3342801 RepID=UPI0038629097